MKEVFISYNSADEVLASALNTALEHKGIKTWFAPSDIKASDHYAGNITSGIESCNLVLLIASESSLGSRDIQLLGSQEVVKEIQLAQNNRKSIIPVKIDSAIEQGYDKSLTYHLSTSQWLDASNVDSEQKKIELIVNNILDFLERDQSASFLMKASKNKQIEILNIIEIELVKGAWQSAESLLNESRFGTQYDSLVSLYRVYIQLQKKKILKNLQKDHADNTYQKLGELKRQQPEKYAGIFWYLTGNLSRCYYDLNGIHNPTEGFLVSKSEFKKLSRPRLSTRMEMILSHVKDIEGL